MSALTAALLCAAITSRRDARVVRELRRASLEVLARARATTAQRAQAQADAEQLWDLVAAQPEGDRVPVLVALAWSVKICSKPTPPSSLHKVKR